MRFTLASAALVGAAAAAGSWPASNGTAPVYVTEVVTAFTTFCPEATLLTHGGSTYTVSQATTLTITNCPGGCTVTKPVYSSVVTACSTCSSAPVAPVSSAPAVSTGTAPIVKPSSVPVAPVYPTAKNGTATAYATGAAQPTGSATSTPKPYTGAASQVSAYGAGFLALFGLVAAL
ncbi:hypothetical protein LTR78_007984 [Recurvomyces mirabilis]|uniref:Uncharacterized protein n=1 Tax=Recurvomyces mirabilis TaxID=574656 RepID=A0AAE0TR06_9PEZI|nr:hypothetical protein LTR78_007984 [Recurvomyces mirabilis]KAK5152520.1 hypothetical protein LTS14_008467 [Recurvomyces mirabilis]